MTSNVSSYDEEDIRPPSAIFGQKEVRDEQFDT